MSEFFKKVYNFIQLHITSTKTPDNQNRTALTCDHEGHQHQSQDHLLDVHAALLPPTTVAGPTDQFIRFRQVSSLLVEQIIYQAGVSLIKNQKPADNQTKVQ